MKMIEDSQPRPDDICEIDGEAINDVRILLSHFGRELIDCLDHYCGQSHLKVRGAHENCIRDQ